MKVGDKVYCKKTYSEKFSMVDWTVNEKTNEDFCDHIFIKEILNLSFVNTILICTIFLPFLLFLLPLIYIFYYMMNSAVKSKLSSKVKLFEKGERYKILETSMAGDIIIEGGKVDETQITYDIFKNHFLTIKEERTEKLKKIKTY